MKPIPAEKDSATTQTEGSNTPLPGSMAPYLSGGAGQNRRISKSPSTNGAYPWLLLASTATAALFCFMYLTKPVMISGDLDDGKNPPIAGGDDPQGSTLLPSTNQLPGEKDPAVTSTAALNHTHFKPPVIGEFEETNLRMQHIRSVEAPGGYIGRIDVEVPVLYQSRQLRWTSQEVEQARTLLSQLAEHQSKTRQLRSEGADLLKSWDQLLEKSIPSPQLRADSPSLPENQHSAIISSKDNFKLTAESIKLKNSEP